MVNWKLKNNYIVFLWLASLKICSQSTVPQAKRSRKHTGEYLVLTVDVFVSLQMSSRSRIRVMNHSWRSSIIFGACTFLFSSWINGKSSQPFCLCLCLPKDSNRCGEQESSVGCFEGKDDVRATESKLHTSQRRMKQIPQCEFI